MTLTITHKGIELTPAIKQYAEEKMMSLEKYLDSIRHIDIEVGRAAGHSNKGDVFECKVVVQIGGQTIMVERQAEDLYKAIDKVRDHLRNELTEFKQRMQERSKGKESRE